MLMPPPASPQPSEAADAALARALLAVVQDLAFADTADALRAGAPIGVHPSIDLALAAFGAGGAVRCANVLFSRENPAGVVADIGPQAGPARNIRFDADIRDAHGVSAAWLPGADWKRLHFPLLHGPGPHRFVAPYPASLLKLMVAVGVACAVDRGLCAWPAEMEPMITRSDNDATTAMVALLHRCAMVEALHDRFAELGLPTLQLHGTRGDGGWRNADGAGVGRIHMTAWDTVRLLWLLDADAPPPPWLPPRDTAARPLLQPRSRDRLRALLQAQTLNEVLSSGSLHGVPGHVGGIPDGWRFAHKTGTTETYASDAGIVRGPGGEHAIVAVLTTLGRRHAPDPRCATTWRLPALGAAMAALLTTRHAG